MSQAWVAFSNVTFRYETAPVDLFQHIMLHIAEGWSGVVGHNGSGKTTLLKLAAGLLAPEEGHIHRPQQVVYCPQRTDHPPACFEDFVSSLTKSSQIIKGQLGIQADWPARWTTLSHGERKRAQIAVALWREPDMLAIDEPTNHVDAEARALIAAALHSYPGVGMLVSHDRELLDTLCQRTIFVDPPNVVSRKGDYTEGKHIASEEQKAIRKRRTKIKRAYKKLHREAVRRRDKANRADGMRSKKGIAKKDHDAKAYIPQEIDIDLSKKILADARMLPNEQKGHLMTIVSRLGSRPERLLESAAPSPGETRKLLLALGMTRQPHIILMDEPTNHMDLPSIECLEQALAECPCCLVLISHDRRFLDELTRQRWHIAKLSAEKYSLSLTG